MFGGRKENNEASNLLTIFKVQEDERTGRAKFKIINPKTSGRNPQARYMHTMTYFPRLGNVVLYGGRNDFQKGMQVYDDVWVLALNSMEWIKVLIGGKEIPIPRCCHTALANQT